MANMIKLSEIKPNPNNPRSIKKDKFEKLKASIQKFPKMLEIRPIVIDENNISLGGNMRLKALQELGFEEIPETWIRKEANLTDEEKRQFIIKDNIGYGEWEWEMIAAQWDIEEVKDWGLDVPMQAATGEGADDGFEVPKEVDTDIKLGDIFDIGAHRLICGDSTKEETFKALLRENMADLVVTDPPYNVDYTGKTKDAMKIENDKMSDDNFYQFLLSFYKSVASITKQGGVFYIWHADSEVANFRRAMKDAGIMVKQCLIWVKDTMVMGRKDYHWKHEPCLYGWKEGAAHNWYTDRKQTTVLEFDRPKRNAEHPTIKPVELIAYQIKNSSKQGDIVVDAFGGSGTTMVASHQLGRRCFMVEFDPKYCQVIVDRMMKLEPGIDIKKNGEPYKK